MIKSRLPYFIREANKGIFHIRKTSSCVYEVPWCDSKKKLLSRFIGIDELPQNAKICKNCLRRSKIKIREKGDL
jgi:hypothetical protein